MANLVGIVRKNGMPNFKDPLPFIQNAAMSEEFVNVTYLMATVMSNGGLMVSGPLIISAVMFIATDLQKSLTANPNMPGLSIPQVKNLIEQGASANF